jgi:hypothetical protein
MGQSLGSNQQGEQPTGDIQQLGSSKLVVTHVEVIRQREVVKIPVLVEENVPTTKYTVVTEETVQYKPRVEETVRYEETVAPTTRFVVREEETTKYIQKDVVCERPVVTDKIYERPVVVEKEYQLVTFSDLEAIKEAMALLPKLLEEVKELRRVRIVEEVVKVPKIEYVPTTVMRVSKTGELIKDVD